MDYLSLTLERGWFPLRRQESESHCWHAGSLRQKEVRKGVSGSSSQYRGLEPQEMRQWLWVRRVAIL